VVESAHNCNTFSHRHLQQAAQQPTRVIMSM